MYLLFFGCSGVSQADYDAVTKERDELREQVRKIGPDGEKKHNAEDTQSEELEIENEVRNDILYEKDGIKITFTGIGESFMGPELNVIIENSKDFSITVQARDASVNGFMASPTFSCKVMPGKKAKHEITFLRDDIEGGEIEDVEISFTFFKTDTFDTFANSDVISITI